VGTAAAFEPALSKRSASKGLSGGPDIRAARSSLESWNSKLLFAADSRGSTSEHGFGRAFLFCHPL